MSIWNKILIFLVISLSIACFVFAIYIFSVRQHWLEKEKVAAEAIPPQIVAREKVMDGEEKTENSPGVLGVRDASIQLDVILHDRQPAWFGCIPTKVDINQGYIDAEFHIDAPDAGLNKGSFVHIFEESQIETDDETSSVSGEPTKYLGAFIVTGSSINPDATPSFVSVTVASFDHLSDQEMEAVTDSFKNDKLWTVYSKLPTDHYNLFKELEEEEFEKMVPPNQRAHFSDENRELIDFEGRLKYLYQNRESLHMQIVDIEKRLDGLTKRDKPIADNKLKWEEDTYDQLMKECVAMAAQLVDIGCEKIVIRRLNLDAGKQQQTVMEVTKENVEAAAAAQKPDFDPADYYSVAEQPIDQQILNLIANGSDDENVLLIQSGKDRYIILEITPGGLISDFETLIARQKSDIDKQILENEKLARAIAEAQQQAVDLIEQRGGAPNQK